MPTAAACGQPPDHFPAGAAALRAEFERRAAGGDAAAAAVLALIDAQQRQLAEQQAELDGAAEERGLLQRQVFAVLRPSAALWVPPGHVDVIRAAFDRRPCSGAAAGAPAATAAALSADLLQLVMAYLPLDALSHALRVRHAWAPAASWQLHQQARLPEFVASIQRRFDREFAGTVRRTISCGKVGDHLWKLGKPRVRLGGLPQHASVGAWLDAEWYGTVCRLEPGSEQGEPARLDRMRAVLSTLLDVMRARPFGDRLRVYCTIKHTDGGIYVWHAPSGGDERGKYFFVSWDGVYDI